MEARLQNIRELASPEAPLSAVALWCVRFRYNARLLRLIST